MHMGLRPEGTEPGLYRADPDPGSPGGRALKPAVRLSESYHAALTVGRWVRFLLGRENAFSCSSSLKVDAAARRPPAQMQARKPLSRELRAHELPRAGDRGPAPLPASVSSCSDSTRSPAAHTEKDPEGPPGPPWATLTTGGGPRAQHVRARRRPWGRFLAAHGTGF